MFNYYRVIYKLQIIKNYRDSMTISLKTKATSSITSKLLLSNNPSNISSIRATIHCQHLRDIVYKSTAQPMMQTFNWFHRISVQMDEVCVCVWERIENVRMCEMCMHLFIQLLN